MHEQINENQSDLSDFKNNFTNLTIEDNPLLTKEEVEEGGIIES